MATYTIQDFGPNDLTSSPVEYRRRVKTASMSAADVAALESKLYSFSAPYTIAAGDSIAFNINMAGQAIFYSIEAQGMTIGVHKDLATGTHNDIYAADNMNFVEGNGFTAFMQKMLDYSIVVPSSKTCISPCMPSVVADFDNPFSITLTNNTGSAVTGDLSLTLESLTDDYVTPFGLSADTLLSPTTEMSVYA